MTTEELDNLIELKYKEIEELESQKEGLVDYYLKDVGEQMVKHKYYIFKYNISTSEPLRTFKVKSYEIVHGELCIYGFINTSGHYPDLTFIDDLKYSYNSFTPISKQEHDDILDMFKESYELLENIQSKINQIKIKNEKVTNNTVNTNI